MKFQTTSSRAPRTEKLSTVFVFDSTLWFSVQRKSMASTDWLPCCKDLSGGAYGAPQARDVFPTQNSTALYPTPAVKPFENTRKALHSKGDALVLERPSLRRRELIPWMIDLTACLSPLIPIAFESSARKLSVIKLGRGWRVDLRWRCRYKDLADRSQSGVPRLYCSTK